MALQLVSVTRRFGRQSALDDVSLHVRPGDCYGFLGHNGAGKTTSLRIALGLERADAGRVLVEGFDADRHPREARARMGGLVETPGFHGHLTGAQNLRMLARLQGLDRSAARRESQRVLDAVGLAGAGAKPVRAWSHGMRQRLGIAQALLGSPRILLLDEPMNGLDPEGIEEVRRLLLRLTREEGTTVLLSSHQLVEIAGMCNRIGIVRQGRMLVEEETAKLLAAETGRYTLATGDDAAAAPVLASLGLTASPRPAGGLDIALGARQPGDVARELVARGVELRAWTPRPASLEEIYLRFTQQAAAAAAPAPGPIAETASPAARLAPKRAALRVLRYEVSRWASTAAVPLLLAIPSLVAAGEVWSLHVKSAKDVQRVGSGALATASGVTAFQATGLALQVAFPLCLMAVAGIASQSVAGESARGTLRNLLLRPMRRTDAVTGKAFALLAASAASYGLVVAAALAAAAHWFDFADLVEILPNGAYYHFEGGEAARMWPALWSTLAKLLPVLAAFAGIGFLAGVIARSGAAALALALGGITLIWILSVPAGLLGVEGWMPTAHAPLVGNDSSVVGFYVQTTQNMSNASDAHAGLHIVAPLAWAAATFAASAYLLRRRSIR